MKQLRKIIMPALLIAGVGALAFSAQPTHAIDVWGACSGGNSSAVCNSTGDSAPNLLKNVINAILFVLGMVAVIMIVIGGIRYTTSNGDSGSTKSAKDTILYAVIGLVVAILAFAIVNFVVSAFDGGSGGGGNAPAPAAPAANSQPGGTSTTITPGTVAP